MKDEATTMPGDAQLEAYILGSLPEGVAKALEDEVFTEDGAFERLQMAEERLLERYADGALDADARARLEARLLATPEGQRRLALTQALDQRGHAARVPWWRRRWTLGAAVSGVAVAAILLFVVIPSLPTTVTLAPSALRAASAPAVAELAGATLRLRLELDPAHPRPAHPQVRLLAAGFERAWPAKVEGEHVVLEVPTVQLSAGTFEVRLQDGGALVSTYALELRAP